MVRRLQRWMARKQRKLSYRTPLRHRHPIISHVCSAVLQHFQTSTKYSIEFAMWLPNASQVGLGYMSNIPRNLVLHTRKEESR